MGSRGSALERAYKKEARKAAGTGVVGKNDTIKSLIFSSKSDLKSFLDKVNGDLPGFANETITKMPGRELADGSIEVRLAEPAHGPEGSVLVTLVSRSRSPMPPYWNYGPERQGEMGVPLRLASKVKVESGGKIVTKFVSEGAKQETLKNIAEGQDAAARKRRLNTLGRKTAIKGKKGQSYNMVRALTENIAYGAKGSESQVYSAAHDAFVAKAKKAGVTGVTTRSAQATIISKAKAQGKWGEVASYFRHSEKSPSGYAYNKEAIAEDLAKNPGLAAAAGLIPKDY